MARSIRKQYTVDNGLKTIDADLTSEHLSVSLKDGNDVLVANFINSTGDEAIVAVLPDERRNTFHRYVHRDLHAMVKYHRSIGIKNLIDFIIYYWGSGSEYEEQDNIVSDTDNTVYHHDDNTHS